MRSLLKYSSAALLVFTVATQSASAQFVQQSSRPINAFSAIWSSVDIAPVTTVGGVTASTTGGDWENPWSAGSEWMGGFTDGEYLLFGFNNNVVTLDFATSIHAFGTQGWYDAAGGGNVFLQAFFQGNLVGSFNQMIGGGGAPNNNQAEVLAFTSTADVDRVVLTAGSDFAINQLGADSTVVPEPTSAAMLAGAFAVLSAFVRRRKRNWHL